MQKTNKKRKDLFYIIKPSIKIVTIFLMVLVIGSIFTGAITEKTLIRNKTTKNKIDIEEKRFLETELVQAPILSAYIHHNCTINYSSNKPINNGLENLASAIEFKLNYADDYILFGEATDANDGPPPDSYDEPKPPSPPTPYIRAWFNDSLNEPYNFLWKDYRHYPDNIKQWNLSVQWVPSDYVTPTTVTISWSTSEVVDSEYNIVKLCDSGGVQLKNMLTENSYSFTCPAVTPQIFYIICQADNIAPEKPEKPSGQTQVNTDVEYTYSSRTIDTDGDQIYYWFDLGDGINSGWIGPYASGETANIKHIWTVEGTYQIKVKAKDTFNAESDWSDPLTVIVDNTPPKVKIEKPVRAVYLFNKSIIPRLIRLTLIIGSITIEVNATDNETGIEKVVFYGGLLGNKFLGNDTTAPYNLTWKRGRIRFIHIQILKVIAYDKVGNKATDFIIVRKIV